MHCDSSEYPTNSMYYPVFKPIIMTTNIFFGCYKLGLRATCSGFASEHSEVDNACHGASIPIASLERLTFVVLMVESSLLQNNYHDDKTFPLPRLSSSFPKSRFEGSPL